jgi:hypothetical protein
MALSAKAPRRGEGIELAYPRSPQFVRAPDAPRSARASADGILRALQRGAAATDRWLRADVGEAIRLQLAPSRRATAPDAAAAASDGARELRTNLLAWSSALRRRRALVIARRHLIAALALAIVAELVLIVLGDDRHGPWLLAALGLFDGTLALRRPVRLDRVARMLDRCLSLHDLLVTAWAIEGEHAPPLGLSALVAEEARTAAAASFATVRLAAGRRGREWSWLLAGLVVLAALAAVPGLEGARSARHAVAPAVRARGSAATPAPAKATAPPVVAQLEHRNGTPGTGLARPPLAVTEGGTGKAKETGFRGYGSGGKDLTAQQLARLGISLPNANTKALGALSVGEAGNGSTGGGTGARNANNGGAAGTGTAGEAKGTPSQGGGAVAGGSALTPAHSHGAGLGAGGTKEAGAGQGGGSSGHSPPGGGAAGTSAGSTTLGSGLVPALGTGTSGLPLQAGYAPTGTRGSTGNEAVSQTPNGGGSGGRSAHSSGGGEGSASSSLSALPPTFNSTPALDQGVLSSFFGSANQLTTGNW